MQIEQHELKTIADLVVASLEPKLEELRETMHGSQIAFSEKEAAELIGVTRHALSQARRQGRIQAGQVGKGYVYTRQQLLEFVSLS